MPLWEVVNLVCLYVLEPRDRDRAIASHFIL